MLERARLMNQEKEIGGPRGRERRHKVSKAFARFNDEWSSRAREGGRGLSAKEIALASRGRP